MPLEPRVRETIRIPNELYDRAMQLAHDRDESIHDLAENAVRFWLSVLSDEGEQSRVRITDEEERMVTVFLQFVRRADSDLVSAVSHIVENWRRQQRMPRQ